MKTSVIRSLVLLAILFSLSFRSSADNEKADFILTNGKIVSVDASFGIYSSMAVKGDRILAVGTVDETSVYNGDGTRVIDLQGRTVLPGLIDSHGHPAAACLTEFNHPIPTMESIQDVLNYIKSRVDVLDDGDWIWVSQVFLTRLKEERYPTRAELDAVAPSNPTVFRTGPDASVNSLALEMSGIDEDWKVGDGGPGHVEKDPDTGKLNGILRSCTRYLKYKSPNNKPSLEEHREKLKELFADYNRVGITGVGERDADADEVALYQSMYDRGELNVRSYLSRHVDTIQSIEDIRKAIRDIAAMPLFKGDDMLRVGALKVYMDGGMLTGSAYMREPWGVSDFYNITDPEYRGLRFIPEDKLIAILETGMECGVQFNAHSVGDGAVHGIVDCCVALKDRFNIREKRPVICHSNFMSEEAVRLVSELGICMDIQPPWLHLDGRTLHNHFGYERLTWFQPLKSLFASGAIAGGGSDHMQKIGSVRSINFYDPWLSMWTAMTRKAKWMDRPLHPEQALSRVEAIRFYTINNAYIHFAENKRGSLEPGKLADFIVVDRDVTTCPVDAIKDVRVLETFVGGKRVYAKDI